MTPTSSEKQAALACADGGPCDVDGCGCLKVLASALRRAEAELEGYKTWQKDATEHIEDLRGGIATTRSRLKTLEEENARMRATIDSAILTALRYESMHDRDPERTNLWREHKMSLMVVSLADTSASGPVCGECHKHEIDHPVYEYPCRKVLFTNGAGE